VTSPKNIENSQKWWLQNAPNTAPSREQHQIEKVRYIKALKVMVQDKGIPSLCICGATSDKTSKKKGEAPMCASNCQFYKNDKDYERALRDILACTQ
jgi:hypothetical protein